MAHHHKQGIRGTLHRIVVFRVLTRDELGRPKDVVFCPDEETIKLENGMEFFTAWVPVTVVAPRSRAKA